MIIGTDSTHFHSEKKKKVVVEKDMCNSFFKDFGQTWASNFFLAAPKFTKLFLWNHVPLIYKKNKSSSR